MSQSGTDGFRVENDVVTAEITFLLLARMYTVSLHRRGMQRNA